MRLKPQVSVITIFYNAEKFLAEAVDSVLGQTSDRWELLLVDDGSSDGSARIAQDYAQRFPGVIRCLQHPGRRNLGKSSSRNLGIREAEGEYLVFLDADDVFLPEKVERQAALLDAHPGAAMVYGTTEYWFSWTGHPQDGRRDSSSKLGFPAHTRIAPPGLCTAYLKDGGIVPCLCSLMIRRGVVEEVGGFDESLQHLYEDQVLLYKICLEYPVMVDDTCGERYRQHPGSSSSLAIKNGEYHPLRPNPARFAFLSWLEGNIAARGIEDASLRTALRRAFWPYRNPRLYPVIRPIHNAWLLLKVFSWKR